LAGAIFEMSEAVHCYSQTAVIPDSRTVLRWFYVLTHHLAEDGARRDARIR
jgi:hypothetical protein